MDREVDEDKRRRCCCLYRRRRVVITSKGEHDTWVMAEEGLCGRPDGKGRWGGQGMAGRDSRGHVLACCAMVKVLVGLGLSMAETRMIDRLIGHFITECLI
jgi:hypothetical protein